MRQNIDLETIKGLAASISAVEQLDPIIVKLHGDGYVLIAGERRLEALKYLFNGGGRALRRRTCR